MHPVSDSETRASSLKKTVEKKIKKGNNFVKVVCILFKYSRKKKKK